MTVPHNNVQIETWDAAIIPPKPVVRHGRRDCPPAVWGMLGTILVHIALVHSALIDSGLSARVAKPPHRGSPGIQLNSESADLVLMDMSQLNASADTDINDYGVSGLRPPTNIVAAMSMEMPHIDVPADQSEKNRAAEPNSVSDAESNHDHLVGIYSGQIRARIERAWRRPRTPIDEVSAASGAQQNTNDTFRCLVTIVQDTAGRVLETDLLNCNGSPAWRQSLVRAINQASPLPAPPDPKVFTRTVTLNFLGFAFGAGMESDEYEPEDHPLALAGSSIR